LLGKTFQKLVEIVNILRSPEGCPWDREQTHQSLSSHLLEEAYEVLESIDNNDFNGLQEELGDLLLQSVFHAQIAKENGQFTMLEVLEQINQKLIRRHPHVFGTAVIKTAADQHKNWENIKRKEGGKSVLDGVPPHSPSLLRAYRIQRKASTVGFDWNSIDPIWEKINEEIEELREVITSQDKARIQEELGDLIFAIVNLSRFIQINPENALRLAINKFINRFNQVENTLKAQGKEINDATLEEMDEIWNQVKER